MITTGALAPIPSAEESAYTTAFKSMKFFTATLATLLIASPAMARPTLEQTRQAKTDAQSVLDAVKRGDNATACSLYIKAADYKEQTGQAKFWPVTLTSAKGQRIQHESNEITAKLNAMVNKNGKALCGSRWVYRNWPTSYSRSSGVNNSINVSNTGSSYVNAIIRSRCEKEWGTDYRMVAYCVKNQTKAARSLGY